MIQQESVDNLIVDRQGRCNFLRKLKVVKGFVFPAKVMFFFMDIELAVIIEESDFSFMLDFYQITSTTYLKLDKYICFL